ncbi:MULTISPECIES: type II secretion system F family protein [unclassified Pseudodesulfovibrio]|uniref:type II secretion system F family protein n=1 Tax=unclassified Pseudodesulfovibrio TaxID=2661612 RepID=UPI000FEBA313|nr:MULTISPECIES: type II secretion system F family protein [unclassified Pseudodesulfovibrio]MCJ2164431.1 type II secretion system F family protein [Pseudodesulfovibrio sp. S3-i]RWU04636.1 type II secretion system F family protein [Pseudodesulfovibrio sp. S3]
MNEQMIPLFAASIGFVSVLLAGYGLIGYLSGANESARLKERVSGTTVKRSAALVAPLSVVLGNVVDFFGRLGTKIGPSETAEIDKSRMRLVQAGLRKPDSYKVFQGLKGCLAVVFAGIFLAARYLIITDTSLAVTAFGAVLLAALGVYGPEYWLSKKIARRKAELSDELPDALDLLVVCVESGMGLDQAVDRVCHEMRTSGPIISSEFKLLTLELRAGKSRVEALRSLALRAGLDDLNSLTSLLIQADSFGISVGRTLRVYSDAMRLQRSQRAEEKAAKMPVLLLLPLILFILPTLFVTILGPAVIMCMDMFIVMNK